MTLQKGQKHGCMTLQKFGQPLVLVAASVCKCGGCMTLQKSAFRWLHEAANWHSEGGSRFIERILTVRATLRLQGRTILPFILTACEARLRHTTPP